MEDLAYWLHTLSEFLENHDGAITAVATVFIAFFTIALALSTKKLWKETKAASVTAEKAANAATLSANAAVAIELPILRAESSELLSVDGPIPTDSAYGGAINDSVPTKYSAVGGITLKNYGRTNAFPITFGAGWKVAHTLPEIPIYLKTIGINHSVVIRPVSEDPESSCYADFHTGIELTEEEIATIANGTSWLWFYGFVMYNDFMNNTREARFCWRFANRNAPDDTPFYFFASDGNPPRKYILHAETKPN